MKKDIKTTDNDIMLNTVEKKVHFCHFHIAGLTYYDACDVIDELKVGTMLSLVRDAGNKHDANAIAIFFRDTKLGFVPADDAEQLAPFFDMGHGGIFEAKIQSVDTSAHPERQIGVKISLLNAKYL